MRDETLRRMFHEEAYQCKVAPTTWEEIQRRAVTRRSPARRAVRPGSWGRRTLSYAAVATVVLAGVAASGFASPTMANVLAQIPGVGSIWQQFATKQKQLATPQHASVANVGVRMAVTRTFYDNNRLVVYYDLTIPDKDVLQATDGQAPKASPTDALPPQLSFRNRDFLTVNGQPLQYNSMMGDGENKVGSDTYSGSFDVEGITTPLTGNDKLTIHATQLGKVMGDWRIAVPINTNVQSESKTIHAMVTKSQPDGLQVTVKDIKEGPVTWSVNYEISQPLKDGQPLYDPQGLQVNLLAGSTYLASTGGNVPSTTKANGRETEELQVSYMAPATTPSTLQIRTTYTNMHPNPQITTISVPVTTTLPIPVDQGTYGVSKVTKIDFEASRTVVYEDLSTQSLEHPLLAFRDEHGKVFKDTLRRTSDGGEIFPAIQDRNGLTIVTEKATGDIGQWKPLSDLDMNVPLQ